MAHPSAAAKNRNTKTSALRHTKTEAVDMETVVNA